MRDKLIQSFGGAGFVLWLILGFFLSYMPLWFLPIHGLALFAIIAVIMFIPIVGDVVNFILWVVSFPVVLKGPQDWLAIAYYIVFAVNMLFNVIPIMINIPLIANILGEIKLITPKHFIRETAPLRFLRFVKVILKIGIALQSITLLLFYILPSITLLDEYGAWFFIPFGARMVSIVLAIFASEKLEDWKWLGVKLLYLQLLWSCILSATNQMLQRGADWSIAIGCLLGWLIWMVPMYIYFAKRRPLFDPPIAAIPQQQYAQQEAQMQQFVVDESTGEVISEPEEPEPVTLEYHPDFQLQGPPEEPQPEPSEESPAPPQKPSGKSYAPLCIVLGILLAASLAGNMAQSYMSENKLEEMTSRQDKLQAEVNSLQNRVSSLREEKDQLSEQLSNAQYSFNVQDEMVDMLAPEAFALETYIGFIYDGSQYCHNYNCPSFPFDDCADDGFYAHNVEYCEWLGYPKHSGCWD